jgi:tripeptidyl-peptidase-1
LLQFSITMQLLSIAAIVGSLLLSVQAAAVPNHGLAVHERRNAPHREWIKRDRISARTILPVRIGLKQQNLEKGHEFLMDV